MDASIVCARVKWCGKGTEGGGKCKFSRIQAAQINDSESNPLDKSDAVEGLFRKYSFSDLCNVFH